MNERKYKTELCKYYKSNKGCDKGNKCSFIHDEKVIKNYKKKCISGSKCYKKGCLFLHPDDWNYKNNIKTCEFFKNGYCINENNCDFKHIKEQYDKDETNNNYNIEIQKKKNENIDINDNNDFPILKENILESKNLINTNDDKEPNVKGFIDDVEYDNKSNIFERNENINDKYNEKEIKDINKLQYSFSEISNEIKNKIDEIFIEKKFNYGIKMKMELNTIMAEIELFKNNYQDIIKYQK